MVFCFCCFWLVLALCDRTKPCRCYNQMRCICVIFEKWPQCSERLIGRPICGHFVFALLWFPILCIPSQKHPNPDPVICANSREICPARAVGTQMGLPPNAGSCPHTQGAFCRKQHRSRGQIWALVPVGTKTPNLAPSAGLSPTERLSRGVPPHTTPARRGKPSWVPTSGAEHI